MSLKLVRLEEDIVIDGVLRRKGEFVLVRHEALDVIAHRVVDEHVERRAREIERKRDEKEKEKEERRRKETGRRKTEDGGGREEGGEEGEDKGGSGKDKVKSGKKGHNKRRKRGD